MFGGRSIDENLESLGINRTRCLVRIRKAGGASGVYFKHFPCTIKVYLMLKVLSGTFRTCLYLLTLVN